MGKNKEACVLCVLYHQTLPQWYWSTRCHLRHLVYEAPLICLLCDVLPCFVVLTVVMLQWQLEFWCTPGWSFCQLLGKHKLFRTYKALDMYSLHVFSILPCQSVMGLWCNWHNTKHYSVPFFRNLCYINDNIYNTSTYKHGAQQCVS